MLDKTRKKAKSNPVYGLTAWNTEGCWYIYRTPFFTDPKREERGPYSSIGSATLMIARELAKEAVKRHQKP